MEYARYEGPGSRPAANLAEGPAAFNWLLLGIGIGAGAALLFAPVTGRQLRGMLFRGCRSALKGINRGTQELRSRGSNLLSFRHPRMG